MFRVISLGWGTQSFGLAAMSALGDLPPVNAAVFADTGHERLGTYGFARRWTPWLEEHGVRVVTVKAEKQTEPIETTAAGEGKVMIPAFSLGAKGRGVITRQCTNHWKIRPIRRWLQANRGHDLVELWMGITTDEAGRIKPADVQYIQNRWPFIERDMSRAGVAQWLTEHGLEVPPRSACVFCPFQSKKDWQDLRANAPVDWRTAVAVDDRVRAQRPPDELYLHSTRVPLPMVKLGRPQDAGQLEMDLFDNECAGVCGL